METYFVVMPDGQKFGPADVPTLNTWAAEGRLFPNSVLEAAATGQKSAANMIQGIVFPASGVQAQTSPTGTVGNPNSSASQGGYVGYSRSAQQAQPTTWLDRTFANTGMIVLFLGSCCCSLPVIVLAIAGVIACKDPEAKRKATITLFLCIGFTILGICIKAFLPAQSNIPR